MGVTEDLGSMPCERSKTMSRLSDADREIAKAEFAANRKAKWAMLFEELLVENKQLAAEVAALKAELAEARRRNTIPIDSSPRECACCGDDGHPCHVCGGKP